MSSENKISETIQEVKETIQEVKEINEWEDLNAKTPLLRGIYANGYEKPSPIQRKAILPLFEKKDIIAQAQSGTGKTACFSIGALQLIDIEKKAPQAIILSPTRELSIQTKKVIFKTDKIIDINDEDLESLKIISKIGTEICISYEKSKFFSHFKVIYYIITNI